MDTEQSKETLLKTSSKMSERDWADLKAEMDACKNETERIALLTRKMTREFLKSLDGSWSSSKERDYDW